MSPSASGLKTVCELLDGVLIIQGMELRDELPGDKEPVREIHLRAFGDHGLAVADLVDSLRETITPAGGLSLVAGHDGQIVGHAMFTRSLLDAPRRLVEVHVLSPLAVMPGYHRRGIGSALVRQGLKVLAERAVPVVFLEGDPGYYARFGFAPGRDLGFRKPSLRIPDGAFQAIRLPAYEPWMTGTLVYAEHEYAKHCNGHRPHQSLQQEPPRRPHGHAIDITARTEREQVLSGLISEYRRAA